MDPGVYQASHKDQPADGVLAGNPEGCKKFIVLFIDIFCYETVLQGGGTVQDGLRQAAEERIGTAADNHGDHFAVLLQPAGV